MRCSPPDLVIVFHTAQIVNIAHGEAYAIGGIVAAVAAQAGRRCGSPSPRRSSSPSSSRRARARAVAAAAGLVDQFPHSGDARRRLLLARRPQPVGRFRPRLLPAPVRRRALALRGRRPAAARAGAHRHRLYSRRSRCRVSARARRSAGSCAPPPRTRMRPSSWASMSTARGPWPSRSPAPMARSARCCWCRWSRSISRPGSA